MNFGTWNIQRIAGKIGLIAKKAENLNMDITALTETKKKGNGTDIIGEYVHVYSGYRKYTERSSSMKKKDLWNGHTINR